ncbi:MAG: caspase family protein, partial [Gammaproteobacteria bacterium]|nr:caspase family protein [Gammaproteobacteria bacterium]
MSTESTSKPSAFYALLTGIDDYLSPDILNLSGCINDVHMVAGLLQKKFDVAQSCLKILTNEQATHANIKAAFKEHLISQAKAWSDAGKPEPGPAFLFHYSGHGSQAPDPTGGKPGGMDETIVPCDSRTEGVYDIKDWELGAMLDELTDYGADNVTVIMDCCHSGSGTRGTERPALVKTRRCPPDTRPQPNRNPNLKKTTRALSAKQWLSQEKYVLLAACRNTEEANEHHVPEGDGWTAHGAMSYFLVNELNSLSRSLTYRELYERIRHQVNSAYPGQNPQCEGDREREIFAGLRPIRDVLFSVTDKSEGYIRIDGGLAHGITEGSELKVYPPETRILKKAGEALAILRVEEEGAVRSACVVEEGEQNIPLHARVAVHRLNFGNMRRSVLIEIDDAEMRDNLRAFLGAPKLEPYIHIVEQGSADFRITLLNGALCVQDNSGANLLPPYANARISKPGMRGGGNTGFELSRDLPHLVRFQNALELSNRTPYSELADALSVEIKRLDFEPDTQQPVAKPLETEESGEAVFDSGQRIVAEITNCFNRPLYFSVLDLSNDLSVTRLYPRMRGAHEQLEAGRTFSLGLSRKRGEQLTNQLPKDSAEGWDVLKVIATVDETDFEQLEQPPLGKNMNARRGG